MKLICIFMLLVAVIHGEDVIVATEKGLVLVNDSSSEDILHYDAHLSTSGLRTVPLAADPVNSRVFFALPLLSPPEDETTGWTRNTIIAYLNVLTSPKPQPVKLLTTGPEDDVHVRGLAFDETSGTLYWTNMIRRTIEKCTITSGCEDKGRFMKLSKYKEPAAIAVDPCHGYLFWTDNNHTSPSVNRVTFNDKKSSAIVRENLFMPNGLAVDTSCGGRLYWTNDFEGDKFTIESSDLDGLERRIEYTGYYQTPMDLTFSRPSSEMPSGALYWTDWTNNYVWRLDLGEGKSNGPTRMPFRGDSEDSPMGIVTKGALEQRSGNGNAICGAPCDRK